MSKALCTTLGLVLLTFLLTGCPTSSAGTPGPAGPTGPTWTVDGTITSYNMDLAANGTVSIVSGGTHFDEQTTFPAQDVNGAQTYAYSYAAVPAITADVKLTVQTGDNWNNTSVNCTFTVNGVPYLAANSLASNNGTFTVSGVSFSGPTTIEILLNAPMVIKPK